MRRFKYSRRVGRFHGVQHSPEQPAEPARLNGREILAALPAMVFTCCPDGVWNYINPLFCQYIGQSVEAFLSQGWETLLHDDDRTALVSEWQAALESGLSLWREHRMRNADGQYRWVRLQCAAQHNTMGAITGWVGIVTPIWVAGNPLRLEHAFENVLREALGIGTLDEQAVRALIAYQQQAPAVLPEQSGDSAARRRMLGLELELSICRTIAELFGGSFALATQPAGGSTLTVRLPHHDYS